jgi:hypothetical protein
MVEPPLGVLAPMAQDLDESPKRNDTLPGFADEGAAEPIQDTDLSLQIQGEQSATVPNLWKSEVPAGIEPSCISSGEWFIKGRKGWQSRCHRSNSRQAVGSIYCACYLGVTYE